MKKTILFLGFALLLNLNGQAFLNNIAFANTNCFLAVENDRVIKREGSYEQGHSPCSTFKIAISLMGYNEDILIDETHPELPFQDGYVDWLEIWKQPHNPTTWMKDSCVWYSQVITQKLGMQKFKKYITKFDYGNHDVSGDKGKNDGLTHSWLSSSLQVSPAEQVKFLQKLLNNKLPVSLKSHEMTKKILFVGDLISGWKLYGKTGTGYFLNHDGSIDRERQIGWFVGWVENSDRAIIFASYIEDEYKAEFSAGKRAKEEAREKLVQLIKIGYILE